jgi:hypothetical protein
LLDYLSDLVSHYFVGKQMCLFDSSTLRGRRISQYSIEDERQMIEMGLLGLGQTSTPHMQLPGHTASSDILQCDLERTSLWLDFFAKNASAQDKSLKDLLAKNNKVLYQKYSMEAALQVAKAFESVNIPLILGPSLTLGWYQQCNVPNHFTSLDFLVPIDHVSGKNHLRLLQVWSCLSVLSLIH